MTPEPHRPLSPRFSSVLVSAPGKVILFGEHAVVYNKPAIAASLGLRSYAWFRTESAGVSATLLRLNLPDIHPSPIEFPLEQLAAVSRAYYHTADVSDANLEPYALVPDAERALEPLLSGLPDSAVRPAVLAFLHLFLAICPKAPPLDVCVRSELPVGAGLGSSASFSVAVAAGLLALSSLQDEIVSEDKHVDPAWRVNLWAFMAEKVIHGHPSGVDNSLATYGGAKIYSKGQLEPLSGFSSLRFLLTDTCEPKNTKRQVEMVRTRKLQFPSVMDLLIDSVENIVQECKAVFRNVEQGIILEAEMVSSMEALIEMNHGVMAACGVSHPSLETVRLVTASHGLQSKLTGAGGGGCALTFIPPGTTPETISAVSAQLSANGFKCYETEVGGGGVEVRTRRKWDSGHGEAELVAVTAAWEEFAARPLVRDGSGGISGGVDGLSAYFESSS
ncbi:hypothetical protein HDU89_002840 [Geranomyces variabilis]|nr:hypothetical protein HDU89_002840 [Geranomyces variabilis]